MSEPSTLVTEDVVAYARRIFQQIHDDRLAAMGQRYPHLVEEELQAIIDAEIRLKQCDTLSACNRCRHKCGHKTHQYQKPIIRVDEHCHIKWEPCSEPAKQRLEDSGIKIPAIYRGKTFSDYVTDSDNVTAVDFARDMLKSRNGAYFYGHAGVGKTFLASLVAQEFMAAGKSTAFYKVPQLLEMLYAKYRGEHNLNELRFMEDLKTCTLLVLDDFGMEKSTKFVGATLCKIIDARAESSNRLTTIITSNLSPEKLRDELDNASDGINYNGTRIYDRLKAICEPILIKGESRRGRRNSSPRRNNGIRA